MAMCVIPVVGAAPCQCFSPGGNQITSPGRISSIGPPQRWCAAAARRHDEGLAQRVSVPGSSGGRFEGYACARRVGWSDWLKQRIDAYGASEPVGGSFAGRLRTSSLDVQGNLLSVD